MEAIRCIFCDTDDSRAMVEENGFTGRKCNLCGLLFVSPRPSPEDIANLYGHDEANISGQAHIAAERYKRLHARHALKVLRKYAASGKLLEIGPGAGFFLDEAKRAGYSPYGIELNGLQADFIRGKLNLPCDSRPLAEAFPGERFDVLYHCDVTSHFSDPLSEFKVMKQRLHPQGILCFETGNIGDVSARQLSQLARLQYPDHLFFLSTANIKLLLDRTGFRLLQIYRYSITPELLLRNWLRRLKGPQTKPVHSTSEKQPMESPASPLKAQIDFWLRYRLGAIARSKRHLQTLIVVATPQ